MTPSRTIELVAWRHAIPDAAGRAAEPQVAGRQQPDDAAGFVDDDQRADASPAHHLGGLAELRLRPNGVRVDDDAVLAPFDPFHFAHLRLDVAGAEPAIDDADAAFFRHGDRHLGAGDRVHVGRDDRALQRQVLRQLR